MIAVDRIVCMNLDSRPERWEECQKEFARRNLEVIRFPAIPGGHRGELDSVIEILTQAKADGLATVLILEDDIEFLQDFRELTDPPIGWDIIYLGACLGPDSEVRVAGDWFQILGHVACTHAMIYRACIFDRVIQHLREANSTTPLDVAMQLFMSEAESHAPNPIIALQRNSPSDLGWEEWRTNMHDVIVHGWEVNHYRLGLRSLTWNTDPVPTIPGWCNFQELYSEWVSKAGPDARFCEVGVWLGQSVAFLATLIDQDPKFARIPGRYHVWAVDTFSGPSSPDAAGNFEIRDQMEALGNDYLGIFQQNMQAAHLEDLVYPVRGLSHACAALFPDQWFDYVYIDASHTYEDALADIKAWLPKTRVAIGGHDIGMGGVAGAVNEMFGDTWVHAAGGSWVKNLNVKGHPTADDGEIDDLRPAQWMPLPSLPNADMDASVDEKTTEDHENRAADRGCCVSTCSPS